MVEETLQLPALWSQRIVVDDNTARQLIAGSRPAVIESNGDSWLARLDDGMSVPVRRPGEQRPPSTHLELTSASSTLTTSTLTADQLRWVVDDKPTEPEDVLDQLAGRFQLVIEDKGEGRSGLRIPQAGAVHAVLAHWSTETRDPATVVLPTGTGKTETMLALYASERLSRLLIVVPTDNLRTQIAEKFETWGVLVENGVLKTGTPAPVVGRLAHRFENAAAMRRFIDSCNVVVTTPAALPSEEKALKALADRFSHLFIDEAHHVPAKTWSNARAAFAERPVVQFTATPYRGDGLRLGGRLIYSFPLGLAQRMGYFQSIRYRSIVDLADPDRAVAEAALAQLHADLDQGFDHLIMARTNTIQRATEVVLPLYQELGSEFDPQVLHSKLTGPERDQRLTALRSRQSRVMVCVDMFGEGFDFPELKIAALHNPQRSLGAALQFIGRFARSDSQLGSATAVVARPDPGYDPRLRALYAERIQWDEVLQVLSETSIDAIRDLGEFETGFTNPSDDELSVGSLRPKMSTVVYGTECDEWEPRALEELFDPEDVLAGPAVNEDERVVWIVIERRAPVRWADLHSVEDLANHLHVLHWDKDRALLYINSSDLDSLHEDLAQAVCGEGAKRLLNEIPYRALGDIDRPTPTNIGVLSVRHRGRRFSMHVGPDVYEGFSVTEQQTRVKTNIFVNGFAEGEHATMGAARKGRIWSQRAARSIYEWVRWARALGPKLQDDSMDLEALFRSFVRPKPLTKRPSLMPLDIGWTWSAYAGMGDATQLISGDVVVDLLDAELALVDQSVDGPIRYQVRAGDFTLDYQAVVDDEQLVHRALGADARIESGDANGQALSDYLNEVGCTIWFEDEVTIEAPDLLLEILRDRLPLDIEQLVALDWPEVDFKRESMGTNRDPKTVQGRSAERLIGLRDWDVVIDDDGTGEVADLVALKRQDEELVVHLVHCKYSSDPEVGARVEDLYEVCGQAQRSAHHRHHASAMIKNLIRREGKRQAKGNSGLLVGSNQALVQLQDWAQYRRVKLHVTIAQPGFGVAAAQRRHLELLSCTDLYIKEIAFGGFDVWCSG